MIVLAIDTSTASGSLAVARDGVVLAATTGDPGTPHGRRLPGDVVTLLGRAGIAIHEIDVYGVAIGPGAFTGLRIGIAVVQGLAFANARPVVGISALEAIAHTASDEGIGSNSLVGIWMDAARHEVFSALYTPGDQTVSPLEGPAVAPPGETLQHWRPRIDSRPVVFAGDGALRYESVIRASGLAARIATLQTPVASTMTRLAAEAHIRGLSGPPHALRPLYVRRPDAVLARERDERTSTGVHRRS